MSTTKVDWITQIKNLLKTGSTPNPTPAATGTPPTTGWFVDGTPSTPQAANANASIVFQRVNGLPSNIASAFVFDGSSTSAAGADYGVITATDVIHDQTVARGGTASRSVAYADKPVASASIVSATISGADIIIITSAPHFATVAQGVIIAGTSGITGLNSLQTVTQIDSPTQLRIATGSFTGGPASGGTLSVPVAYFASWDSAWKQTGPNIRVVGHESDMNNNYADAGASAASQDATFNYAVYSSGHNNTCGIFIDSGDGSAKYYHPLIFGPNAVVANYPYIDTSGNNNAYAADFAWIGNNQFLRWLDNVAGKWPILGLDSGNNVRIGAPTGNVIAIGPNLSGVLEVGANYVQLNGGPRILSGAGSPNSAVVGNPGDMYLNTSGGSGTTLYIKESGTGTNTGWVGK